MKYLMMAFAAVFAAVECGAITATKEYVDRKDAAVATAATNYTDAAIAGISGVTPLVVTNIANGRIEVEVAPWARSGQPTPAPGNYAAVSNAAMTAVQPGAIADMETKTHAAATYLTSESDPVWTVDKPNYQQTIADLATIRSGAALGTTSLQLSETNSFAAGILTKSGRDSAAKIDALSNNLATVAFTGDYDDLDNLPTIPAEYTDAQAKAQAVAAIAETDTAYTYTNALVALNQSVQYITPSGGTVTLVIPAQTEGRLRDFIVDVYPTADTIVNFTALGHARFTDAAVTNTVKANVFTTFSISESGGGVFKVGRANLEKGW